MALMVLDRYHLFLEIFAKTDRDFSMFQTILVLLPMKIFKFRLDLDQLRIRVRLDSEFHFSK